MFRTIVTCWLAAGCSVDILLVLMHLLVGISHNYIYAYPPPWCRIVFNVCSVRISAELLALLSDDFRFRLRKCAGSGPIHLLVSIFSVKYALLGISPNNSGKVHRLFRRTYRFHLQSVKVSKTKINKNETANRTLASSVLYVYCLDYSSALRTETICFSETSWTLPN